MYRWRMSGRGSYIYTIFIEDLVYLLKGSIYFLVLGVIVAAVDARGSLASGSLEGQKVRLLRCFLRSCSSWLTSLYCQTSHRFALDTHGFLVKTFDLSKADKSGSTSRSASFVSSDSG